MTTTKPRVLGIMMAVSLTLSSVNAYRNVQASSIDCSVPGSEGLFITKEKFEYADSELACISIGGSPIDLNNENFPIASKFMQSCTGPERLAWIGSWDYQPGSSDCQDCLSVSIGGSKPGEGIVDQNCKGPNHVLCQVGSSVVKHNPNYQLGQDIPRKINIAPHYGGYYGYAPNGYPGVTPAYYPGQYRNKFNPPHGPKGGFPGGVFPGGPGFGGGNGQTGWTKKNQNRQQSMAPTTVTVMAPAAAPVTVTEPAAAPVTVTAPAAAPVTVTEPAAAPVTVTEPAAAPVTVTAPAAAPVTVTVTEFAETILTNIELVTSYRTQTDVSTAIETKISTDTATEYLTQYSTLINTVTKDYTELLTTTEVSVREASTVTLQPDTVTLKPVTVTQGGETITIPASTITLPPGTVTLPPETVSLSPVTVTAPPVTTTKTAPVVTSVVYAIRDNTITTTVFSRLPAITSFKTEYQIKYTTSTIITTERVPGPTVTETKTETTTETQTIQQAAPTQVSSISESEGDWMFPFELPDFSGPGVYTLSNGGVISVKSDGTYTLISGSIPGSSNSNTGNAGPDYKFGFKFDEFKGPGLYTLSNGGIITVRPGGSYTFIMGGPPSESSSSGSEVSFSFPFNIPNFMGPGLYTLSPGNVLTVKADGTYNFLQGGPPSSGGITGSGGGGSSSSGSNMSFSFPFDVPGFTGPGTYTLSPGNVVSIRGNGSYIFLQGGPPNGGGSNGSGGGSSGGSISLPFNVPGFSGPGTYTLSPGNVVSIKNDGSYTFLQGGPPSTGGSSGGGSVVTPGGSFNLPFNVPGFSGPGTYTLSPGNVVSIKNDGSYTFLQGGPPSSGSAGGSISLPFNVPGFSGPGIYTLSPGNVVSIKNDGSYTFLQGGPSSTGGSSGGGSVVTPGGSFNLPFNVPGFSGPGTYTLSPGNVVSIKNDGSYTFLQGGPPSSGSAGGSISLPFNVPGFSGPGIYTLSPGNVVSIKNDGSYTFLQGGPPSAGGSSTNNVMSIGTLSVPNKPGIYTLSNGDVVSVSTGGTYSFIRNGSSSSSSSSGSSPVSIPFNVPGFKGPGVYTLSPGNVVSFKSDGSYTFLQGGPPPTGLSGSAPAQPTNANFNGVNIPNYSGSGIYTLLFGNIISIAKDGRFSYISGQGLLGEKTGSFGLPSLSLPSFNFATPSPLPIFQLNQIIDEAEEPEVVKVEPEAVRPSESAEKSGFNFGAVSFPAFARRAIATFV